MYSMLFLLSAPLIGSAIGLFFLVRATLAARAAVAYLGQKRKRFVIAILTPSVMSTISEELIRPFIAYMKKYASFEFEIVECVHSMSREKALEWANYIAENKIDLVLPIGKLSTAAVYGVMKTRHNPVPVISTAVPVGYSEIPPEIMQRTTPFTAISAHLDWPMKINLLKSILPSIRTVLVIFRSIDEISHSNLKEKNAISGALRRIHVGWKMHHVPNIERSTDLTPELLEGVDAVILSRSSEILRYASRIAQEVNEWGIPVFSTDTNSAETFIGISGRSQRAMGIQSARYAIEILEDGVSAADLPLKEIDGAKEIVIHPQTVSPILATTAIGNLLTLSNTLKVALTPLSKKTGTMHQQE